MWSEAIIRRCDENVSLLKCPQGEQWWQRQVDAHMYVVDLSSVASPSLCEGTSGTTLLSQWCNVGCVKWGPSSGLPGQHTRRSLRETEKLWEVSTLRVHVHVCEFWCVIFCPETPILYYTILYHMILYYTILYYIVLYYTILYCTIL